jgi:hypothetical protein
MVVTRELGVPVDLGTLMIQPGNTVILIEQQEDNTKAEFGSLTFWIPLDGLDKHFAPK